MIHFAPVGLFRNLQNLLKTMKSEGKKKLIPLIPIALSLNPSNQLEAVEQRKLGEAFLVQISLELKCLPDKIKSFQENEEMIINPETAKLGVSSQFHLTHFYKALIISPLFRQISMDFKDLRIVIENLLHATLRLIGNPQEVLLASGRDEFFSFLSKISVYT